MNFQKLELQGFKSFADKTEIAFNAGITVIVGPNGCGKSNVADAVRWVLGEQRPSYMRGQSMTDVIFNGTEARRSLSYAEVSLYFDNTSKIFPIDFDSVVLTRKIDRSGVGEYFINKERCRLKDIVMLLHDTGIGREGYSIVGQGRVDQIIHAKPVDRRAIFEEAAGIAGFKAKKLETERRLERATEKILRVKDILHEHELRLEPLSRQARAAEKYNELYAELKRNEVNYFICRYENNKSIVDEITARLELFGKQIADYETEYNDSRRQYEEFTDGIGRMDEEIAVLNERLMKMNVDLTAIRGESKVYAERALGLRNEIRRLENEKESLEGSLKEKSGTIVSVSSETEIKEGTLKKLSAEMAETQRRHDEITEKISSADAAVDRSHRDVVLTAEELGNIKKNLGKYIAERDMCKERLELLKERVRAKKTRLDEEYVSKSVLEGNLTETGNRITAAEQLLAQAVRKSGDGRLALEGYNEARNKIAARISALDERYRLKIQHKESYGAFGQAVKSLMDEFKVNPELKRRSQGLIADIISPREGMEAAMDVAFGPALRNIVTKDEDDARYIIDFLKRRGLGQITFLPMNVIRGRLPDSSQRAVLGEHGVIGFAADLIGFEDRFENVIRGILGNTLVVNNLDTAIRISRLYPYTFKIVTLEGDYIARQGSITGGSRRSDTAGVLALDREIASIKETLEKTRRQQEDIITDCAVAAKEVQDAEKTAKSAEEELSVLRVKASVTKEKISESEDTAGKLEEDIANEAAEIESLSASVRETENKLALADKMEEDLNAHRRTAGELAEQTKSEGAENRRLQADLGQRLLDLRLDVTSLKTEIDRNTIDVERLEKECASISRTLSDTVSLLEADRKELERVEEDSKNFVVNEEDARKIEELNAKLREKRAEKDGAKAKVSEIDARCNDLNTTLNDVKEKKFREEMRLEQTNSEIAWLHQHVWEEYELTYETALAFRSEDFKLEDAGTEINRLKKAINRLGDINPHAIEEYDELKERFDRETEQCEDLEKGKQDLIDIVRGLTEEMTSRFDDAFNLINENFKEVFRDLFDGGRAKLEVVESQDGNPLEAGVEIFAQPPGKKLNHISLLSGGEKTLTAIAILFAIIKMRPMPFCVLDEIDTALDDANADFLAKYLKRFSERTQFIIISHKKPTMEISDSIFGVSMEEKGVSTLLGVNLTEALRFAKEEQ